MWRRVLSQSPTETPTDAATLLRTQRYLNGWKALGALLYSGRSLSGRERNCCFLNTRSAQFADVSAAVGFDHASDSRGLAFIDWDMDGDIDLWITNRTAPRVRYLQNNLKPGSHFLRLKLRGIRCNRDAIGARVELHLKKSPHRIMIQTLSAGEGFVSQSSKWIHFGLGGDTAIDRVVVHWPGNASEEFRGVSADQTYELVQGSGTATLRNKAGPSPSLASSHPAVPASASAKRIVLPRRLPMPELEYYDLLGNSNHLDQLRGRPLLINLWASWCRPCLVELEDWKQHFKRIDAELAVLAINVDYADQDVRSHMAQIKQMWEGLDLPMLAGVVDARALELLEVVDRILLLDQKPLAIPTSFLVDDQGRLAVMYKGRAPLEQLMADVSSLARPDADVRDASVPFPGQWYSDPFPPDLLAIPAKLVDLRRGIDAYDYLLQYVTNTVDSESGAWQSLGVTPDKASNVYRNVARLLVQEGQSDKAAEAYRSALGYQPRLWETHVELADLFIRMGRSAEAIAQSHQMLRLRPGHPLPWNNIAWVLATSDDPNVRDVEEAMKVAEKICRATEYREPTALDTLAVAYAAAGRFSSAIEMSKKAIEIASSLKLHDVADRIRGHLRLFESRQPLASGPVPQSESRADAPPRDELTPK